MRTSRAKSLLPPLVTDSKTSVAVKLQPLEYSGGAHAATYTHRHHAIARVPALQLAQDRRRQFCSRTTQRMAQRDGTTVHVYFVGIQFQHLDHCQRLRGERLVQFNHFNLIEREARKL